jgi:hypothetical protein
VPNVDESRLRRASLSASLARKAVPSRRLVILILGATRETDRVRAAMSAVRDMGHELAMDWTAGRSSESTDDVHTDEEAAIIAMGLLKAIESSDLIVWLVPPTSSQSFGEWLLACSIGARTITSGPESSRTRLLYRPKAETHFATDAEALAWIGAAP